MEQMSDKLLLGRINDLCKKSCDVGVGVYTPFLNTTEAEKAKQIVKQYIGLQFEQFGGFKECERTVLCIFPADVSFSKKLAPIELLKIELKVKEKPSHRDYLGSILALGLKREKIGDIYANLGYGYVAVFKDIAPYIIENLSSVGKNPVQESSVFDFQTVEMEHEYKEITDTIQSPRLDSVVASLTGMARGKAQGLIRGKLVNINHICKVENDVVPTAGDIISIRGYGRFILDDLSKTTKKGRIVLLARKFI